MECVIPGKYVKLFAKTIQCMAKIGEDLFIEMLFRTLNASRSAFMVFQLSEKFFDSFSLSDRSERKYQVKLKSCLAVFRAYNNIETCKMIIDETSQRLVFQLLCKHGIKKVYKLTFEDCEALQAVYSKDDMPNRIVAIPKKLLDCVNNFHQSVEEVTFVLNANHVVIRSFNEDAQDASKVLHTELTLDAADFEEYHIKNETTITFCLKEFKTVLNFCDAAGQAVSLLIEKGGRPMLLSVKYFGQFEADFVLATLIEPSSTSVNPSSTGTATSSQPTASATPGAGKKHAEAKSPAPSASPSTYSSTRSPPLGNTVLQKRKEPDASSPISNTSMISATSGVDSPFAKKVDAAAALGFHVPNKTQGEVEMKDLQADDGEDEQQDDYVQGSPQPPSKKLRGYFDGMQE